MLKDQDLDVFQTGDQVIVLSPDRSLMSVVKARKAGPGDGIELAGFGRRPRKLPEALTKAKPAAPAAAFAMPSPFPADAPSPASGALAEAAQEAKTLLLIQTPSNRPGIVGGRMVALSGTAEIARMPRSLSSSQVSKLLERIAVRSPAASMVELGKALGLDGQGAFKRIAGELLDAKLTARREEAGREEAGHDNENSPAPLPGMGGKRKDHQADKEFRYGLPRATFY
jgi:hypothetical protein